MEPSALVASSGNIFSREELEALQRKGAVGDICFRFYDVKGREVKTDVSDQIGRAHVELQSPDHLVCRLLLEKKKISEPFSLQETTSRMMTMAHGLHRV